ncbi:MAG: hypothetical protein AB7O66_20180 [Limisphaerales bacterium]
MIAPDPRESATRRVPPIGIMGGVGEVGDDPRLGLAGVLRGLSALFWSLPLALMAFSRHFLAIIPTLYDLVLPTAATGLALYGLIRMGSYQRSERIWQTSLHRSRLVGLLVVGLSPFLFLWGRMPSEDFFARAVALLLALALVFLVTLLDTLERLAAMMPDDTVRGDARMFRGLTAYVVAVLAGVSVTLYWRMLPVRLSEFLEIPRQPLGLGRQAILLLLVLVPVAMAMAVTWKLKEVVFAAMIGAGRFGAAGTAPTVGTASSRDGANSPGRAARVG